MNNPLLPSPRRVNWLGKEPEPDLSWFEEELRKHLKNTKRELQFLEGEMLKRRRLHAEVAIREYMLQQGNLKGFMDKDLLKELKEAPVMLINPDNSRSFYGSMECPEGIIPDSDDPDWEGHYYPEDPDFSPELHNLPFVGIDSEFDSENETFFEYLDRMWSNEPD
jgi:hypothetical protein